jgi:hypothetical protein
MTTISDAEFASYLLRAKEKLDNPDAVVPPLSQVVVAGSAASKAGKRGRKDEVALESNKAPRLEEQQSIEDLGEGEDDDDRNRISIPVNRRGRASRGRGDDPPPVGHDVLATGSVGSAAAGGESSKQGSPPTWNEDFDPIAFVAENLKGTSSRMESLSLEELRKLAVGSELKCLALNQMVFARQEAEAKEKLEKEVKAAEEEAKKEQAEVLKKKKADFEGRLKRKGVPL